MVSGAGEPHNAHVRAPGLGEAELPDILIEAQLRRACRARREAGRLASMGPNLRAQASHVPRVEERGLLGAAGIAAGEEPQPGETGESHGGPTSRPLTRDPRRPLRPPCGRSAHSSKTSCSPRSRAPQSCIRSDRRQAPGDGWHIRSCRRYASGPRRRPERTGNIHCRRLHRRAWGTSLERAA